MKAREPLLLRVDRLERRICPSVSGLDTITAVTSDTANEAQDMDASATDPMMQPYAWIRMVMIPRDMMTMVNEYDQAPAATRAFVAASKAADSDAAMESEPASTAVAEVAMPMAAAATPPAQMPMEQAPLVRRSLSPSKSMDEMAEAETGDEESKTGSDEPATMNDEAKSPTTPDRPPMLTPGELAPRIDPELSPAPIGPELERAAKPLE